MKKERVVKFADGHYEAQMRSGIADLYKWMSICKAHYRVPMPIHYQSKKEALEAIEEYQYSEQQDKDRKTIVKIFN